MKYATSLQTKLDAYALQYNILLSACAPKEMAQLLVTIIDVLSSLGEIISDEVSGAEIALQVSCATTNVEKALDDDLLQSHRSNSEHQANVMQAYNILTGVAYFAKPALFPYFAARWVQYCLQNKISNQYTAGEGA